MPRLASRGYWPGGPRGEGSIRPTLSNDLSGRVCKATMGSRAGLDHFATWLHPLEDVC